MAVITDEAGAALFDEAISDIYDEAGAEPFAPVWASGDGNPLNITDLLATPAGTVLLFVNTGIEHLLVTAAGAGVTVTVGIGAKVLGQPVNPFASVTLTAGHLYVFGPFRTILDQPGGDLVQVTLSSVSGVQVALVQWAASR
jgi:hypothetical protein